jgi:hypothetical protein
MRVGSLAFSTCQGLGILAKSFFDAGVLTDALVVLHGRHQDNPDWFAKDGNPPEILGSLRDVKKAEQYCERHDVMLFFETPFIHSLIPFCRSRGIKTALVSMYECAHENLRKNPPDLFLCPSLLDLDYFPNGVFIPIPVQVEWRHRKRAEVFVHNAGWGGLKGRNGTKELLEACRLLKSPAKFIIRSQQPLPDVPWFLPGVDERVRFCADTVPHDELWATGDAFVFPESNNGLSLPLQEARAAGMLVMCGNRHPMNKWLPTAPMIPVDHYRKERIGPPYPEYNRACYDPKTIAATIDAWYGKNIEEYSLSGRVWAEAHSWGTLKPRYHKALEDLVGRA